LKFIFVFYVLALNIARFEIISAAEIAGELGYERGVRVNAWRC
jgi:hypothetical protein